MEICKIGCSCCCKWFLVTWQLFASITRGGDKSGKLDTAVSVCQQRDKLLMQTHYKEIDEQMLQLSGCEHQGAGVAREGKWRSLRVMVRRK